MIKEVSFKANKKNEYISDSIEIEIDVNDSFEFEVDILDQVSHLRKLLDPILIKIAGPLPKADWASVSGWWMLVSVSKKFKDTFENKLKGHWYDTDNADCFIFMLDNCIDALDKRKTEIINPNDRPYWYESIANESFKDEMEKNEYLFTIPEAPLRKLCTMNFENTVKQNNLTGFQFYKEINFKRKGSSFTDLLRLGEYDDEGNCLNKT